MLLPSPATSASVALHVDSWVRKMWHGLVPACVRLSRLATHPLEGSVGRRVRGLRLWSHKGDEMYVTSLAIVCLMEGAAAHDYS
jgi:hypothetical protein